jgi:hypothetical protein
MSELLSNAIARGEDWASDDHYQGILDATGAMRAVTPLQFANDIKERVGWAGHWMMVAEEGNLAARWSKHNIVIIAFNNFSNDDAPEFYKFPVLGPEERDNPAAVRPPFCTFTLGAFFICAFSFQNSLLKPEFPTIVLKFQGDNTGGHYEVVREMSTSREQPAPHNTIYTEKRKLELPSPGGGGGDGRSPPGGPRHDPRKKEEEPLPLPKKAHVYKWNSMFTKNKSYAFPDDREVVPRKTERMLADGNDLYRWVGSLWGFSLWRHSDSTWILQSYGVHRGG